MKTAPMTQLQVFLAVARHRSFSAAARELGVSASAVSQSVRQLEAQLRVPLLTRTTRSVAPTEVGRRLVEAAGPAMGQALAALTALSAQPGEVVGRLKLSVPQAAVPFVIAPVLPTFRARHPRVGWPRRGCDVGPQKGARGRESAAGEGAPVAIASFRGRRSAQASTTRPAAPRGEQADMPARRCNAAVRGPAPRKDASHR